ncbi:acyl-CoA thioesterase domain-containing protein [Streptomyces sp. AC550_RSS872]|uniref:acyl-CoA thioesterase domain-containing protein n=1 Tax=Streptomyces sp. AC550_RSS872 TaxID=2823689 RepID=UPI0035ABE6B7
MRGFAFQTRIDPGWWSWEGAHGGHVAALALAAVRDRFTGGAHPVRTLSTHYLARRSTAARSTSPARRPPSAGARRAACSPATRTA